MAFVWEMIQEAAVLFVYSSSLVSKVGVYTSQRLTKDIIRGLGRECQNSYLLLSKNVKKGFCFLATVEWLLLVVPVPFLGLDVGQPWVLESVEVLQSRAWNATKGRWGGAITLPLLSPFRIFQSRIQQVGFHIILSCFNLMDAH